MMNAKIRDTRRIEQLRDIIAIAQEEIDAIERRNYGSVSFQQLIVKEWFNAYAAEHHHPSQCN